MVTSAQGVDRRLILPLRGAFLHRCPAVRSSGALPRLPDCRRGGWHKSGRSNIGSNRCPFEHELREGVRMSGLPLIVLILGIVLFGVGALTRAYMNSQLNHSSPFGSASIRSTELRYYRLAREAGLPRWPLVMTIFCIPAGMILAFAAIFLSR